MTPKQYEHLLDFIDNSMVKYHGDGVELILNRPVKALRLSLQMPRHPLRLERIKIKDEHGKLLRAPDITLCPSSTLQDDESQFGAQHLLAKDGFYQSKRERKANLVIRLGREVNISTLFIRVPDIGQFWLPQSLLIEVKREASIWEPAFDNWAAMKSVVQLARHDSSLKHEDKLRVIARAYAKGYAKDFLEPTIDEARQISSNLSTELHDLINLEMARDGYGFTHHGINRVFSLMHDDEKTNIATQLSKLMEELRSDLGLETFMTSGTLLGAKRSGELLPHDDDVDISYLSNETTESGVLAERQRLYEYLSDKGMSPKISGRGTHVQARLVPSLTIDFFVAFRQGDIIDVSPLPRTKILVSDILPLKTLELYGVQINAPANVDALLTNNYGTNWRVRDPSWRFDWKLALEQYDFLLEPR